MGVEIRANPQRGVTNSFQADVVQFLNSETVTSVVRGVAPFFRFVAPIASVAIGAFSNLYLVLDPATSLLFVGCAALVNTFVLNYSHDWIQSRWSAHWKDAYPISTLEAGILSDHELRRREAERLREIEIVPPEAQLPQRVEEIAAVGQDNRNPPLVEEQLRQTVGEIAQDLNAKLRSIKPLPSSPQSLMLVEDEFRIIEKKYELVVKNLDDLVEKRKKLDRDIDSLLYGRNGDFPTLKAKSSDKAKTMVELAKKKQEFIKQFLLHKHLLNAHNAIQVECKWIEPQIHLVLDSQTYPRNNIENSQKILDINLKDLHENLSNLFGEIGTHLSRISEGKVALGANSADNQEALKELISTQERLWNNKNNELNKLTEEISIYKLKEYSLSEEIEALNQTPTKEIEGLNEKKELLKQKTEEWLGLCAKLEVAKQVPPICNSDSQPKNLYEAFSLIALQEEKEKKKKLIREEEEGIQSTLSKFSGLGDLKSSIQGDLKKLLEEISKLSNKLKKQKDAWEGNEGADTEGAYKNFEDRLGRMLPRTTKIGNFLSAPFSRENTLPEDLLLVERQAAFDQTISKLEGEYALLKEAENFFNEIPSKPSQVLDMQQVDLFKEKICFLERFRKMQELKKTLDQIEKVLKSIQKKISELTKDKEDFWNKEIVPLNTEFKKLSEEDVLIKLSSQNVIDRKNIIKNQLSEINFKIKQSEITKTPLKKETELLDKDIELLKKIVNFIPVKEHFENIAKVVHPLSEFSSILVEYKQIQTDLNTAGKINEPSVKEKQEALRLVKLEIETQKEGEETFFNKLIHKRAELSEEKLNILRGLRYQSIFVREGKINEFYEGKKAREVSTFSETEAALRNNIQKLSRDILEQKVAIAAEKLKGSSFLLEKNRALTDLEMKKQASFSLINRARLNLAEHRLHRYRLEQQQRISKASLKSVLIKALEREQDLVLEYFLTRYSGFPLGSNVPNDVRANLAVINLVLDAVRIDLSDQGPENLKKFNLCNSIKERLEAAFQTDIAEAFHQAAYQKKLEPQLNSSGIIGNLSNYSTPPRISESKKIIGNEFILNIIKILENDKISDFVATIEGLIKVDSFTGANYRLKIIENKISLIELFVKKSVLVRSDHGFDNDIKSNRERKYAIKSMNAEVVGYRAKKKSSFKKAEENKSAHENAVEDDQKERKKYEDEITLALGREREANAETLRIARAELEREREANIETLRIARTETEGARRIGQGVITAIFQEEADSVRISTNQKQARNQAMANYGWLEKLSYLIPAAAMWTLYRFSPLLNMISLSLRVSQNILLIGSATHLFVRSFFSELEARPSLDDPQQRQAVRALRN